jgi:hypothetical protein
MLPWFLKIEGKNDVQLPQEIVNHARSQRNAPVP